MKSVIATLLALSVASTFAAETAKAPVAATPAATASAPAPAASAPAPAKKEEKKEKRHAKKEVAKADATKSSTPVVAKDTKAETAKK